MPRSQTVSITSRRLAEAAPHSPEPCDGKREKSFSLIACTSSFGKHK